MHEGRPPRILQGHSWFVTGVAWSPDGRFLASCGFDTVLLLWDPTNHSCLQKLGESKVIILSIAWSPHGCLLAYGTHERGIQVWDMTTHQLRWSGQTPLCKSCRVVVWSPDGTQVAGGGEDGGVYLWESAGGTLRVNLLGHQGRVRSVGAIEETAPQVAKPSI